VRALVPAFGRLDIDLGLPAQQLERSFVRADGYAIRRAGQMLAIGAMTDSDRVGIDFGLKGDVTAMASAFDVHGYPPGGGKME
jgi:hypothetical protein